MVHDTYTILHLKLANTTPTKNDALQKRHTLCKNPQSWSDSELSDF